MGAITSLFVRKVVSLVSQPLDPATLLMSIGLDPNQPPDPERMVEDSAYYDLLERIFLEDPRGAELSTRAGASMRCDDYGALGLAMKSAPTVAGSYQRAERHARVLTSVTQYRFEENSEVASIALERAGARRRGLCISNEASLAALLTIAREVSGTPLRPTGVFFKHPEPPQSDPQRRFFEAPVHFASDRDALVFDPQTTATQNRLGDEAIARFFDRHLEGQRAAADWETTLEAQVRAQISQALSDGVPKISHIGARLQMSGRTLQRRLSDSGLSFQTLVDEARHDLAKRLLKHTEYSLAEISFLTGFSEQSAFNRAFKRWQGQTPRSFRLGPTR